MYCLGDFSNVVDQAKIWFGGSFSRCKEVFLTRFSNLNFSRKHLRLPRCLLNSTSVSRFNKALAVVGLTN